VWLAINPDESTLPNLKATTYLISSNNYNSFFLEAEADEYSF